MSGSMELVTMIIPWLSISASLMAVYGFYNQRRTNAVDQGKKQQEIIQLKVDLDRAFVKLHALEESSKATDNDIVGLSRDVKYILASLERIERKLEAKE